MEKSSYLYPLKAILFFFTNPSLWRYALIPLCCSLCFSIICLGLVLGLALVPQAQGLESRNVPAWLSYIIAVVLCLLESFLIDFIISSIFFGYWQAKIFKETLKIKGHKYEENPFCFDFQIDWFLFLFGLLLIILTLPVNVIPILGSILFCIINGWNFGWQLHVEFFKLKKMNFTVQLSHMVLNSGAYVMFGATCTFLALFPLINFLLFFTNHVAAALWAIDMEEGSFSFDTEHPQFWPNHPKNRTNDQIDSSSSNMNNTAESTLMSPPPLPPKPQST